MLSIKVMFVDNSRGKLVISLLFSVPAQYLIGVIYAAFYTWNPSKDAA